MAPTIAGTSCLTIAEDRLVNSVANSSTFQTLVGAVSGAAAKSRIYLDEVPNANLDRDDWTQEEWDDLFPLCLITPPPDEPAIRYVHDANGTGFEYVRSYRFHVCFEQKANETLDAQDALREFKDTVDTIISDMLDQTSQDDRFSPTLVQPVGPPETGTYARLATLGPVHQWKWLFENTVEL